MIRLNKPWGGALKTALIESDWNVSLRTKTEWIVKMNFAIRAEIILVPDKEEVELKFTDSVSGVEYCAWLAIKLDNFDNFVEIFNQD